MGPTLDDVMGDLPAERRERIEKQADQMLAEIDGLAEIRRIAVLSQKQMAAELGITQPSVHQMERQADLYLSTLRRYVKAAGGDLELRVTFPGREPFRLTNIGELAEG